MKDCHPTCIIERFLMSFLPPLHYHLNVISLDCLSLSQSTTCSCSCYRLVQLSYRKTILHYFYREMITPEGGIGTFFIVSLQFPVGSFVD